MTENFLNHLMHFAIYATGAERGMAVNAAGEVVAVQGLPDDIASDSTFTGFRNIEQAYQDGERPHITNNMILDVSQAPKTNTNFANLRLVAVFLLDDMGAVYVDIRVRRGVIGQEDATRVQELAEGWVGGDLLDITTPQMIEQYEAEVS
ncbi:MAG: hypothetical protein AAF125_02305 [Chloroflexota bacterium]